MLCSRRQDGRANTISITSANFERSADQKIVAKVLVTCELTIFGLGSHSATGEEWADNSNAGTAAEAQSFKRAATCFGLGRYLYYFTGTWVDLDERKRPKAVPQLAGWATPAGWREGLRPRSVGEPKASIQAPTANESGGRHNGNGKLVNGNVLREIERMEKTVGKRMYRAHIEERRQSVESQRDSRQGNPRKGFGTSASGGTRIAASRSCARKGGAGCFRQSPRIFAIEFTRPSGQSQDSAGDCGRP